MTIFFIILGLIIFYFVISAVKESEHRTDVQRIHRNHIFQEAGRHVANMAQQLETQRNALILLMKQNDDTRDIYFNQDKLVVVLDDRFSLEECALVKNKIVVPTHLGVNEVLVVPEFMHNLLTE